MYLVLSFLSLIFISIASSANENTVFQDYARAGVGLANDDGKQAFLKLPGAKAKYHFVNECEHFVEFAVDQKIDIETTLDLCYMGMLTFLSQGSSGGEDYTFSREKLFLSG